MMSTPPPTPHPDRRLYEELAEWLAGQLRGPVKSLFDTVDDSLFELAEHSIAGAMQQRYFDGMRECRRRRLQVEQAFGARVAEALLLPPGRPAEQADGLSLVGHEELEEQLAITAMASKAHQRHANALYALTRRLAVVLGENNLDDERNPFGPETLAERFRESIADIDVGLDVRLIILKLFERHVLGGLEALYTELNIRLADAGVLPTLSPKVRREGGRGAPAPTPARPAGPGYEETDSIGTEEKAPATANPDLTRQLADAVLELLMSRLPPAAPGADTAAGSAASAEGASHTPLAEAMSRASSRLRTGSQMPPPRQFAAQLLAEARYAGEGSTTPPEQVAVVDMLGRVFDALLADSRMPKPLQPVMQGMQIPATRAALRDASELTRPESPVRQLIELLGDTAVGWCPSADPKGRLLGQLQEFVDALGDTEDAADRERLIDRLRSALEVQQRRAELAEQRVVEAASGRERLWHARRQIHQSLSARLAKAPVPAWVRHLLTRPWANCMVLLWLRQGESSQAYREADGFADAIQWCANAGGSDVERLRLRALMPVLDGQLRHGLATVAYHEGEIDVLAGQLKELIRWRLGECEAPDFLEREPTAKAGFEASTDPLGESLADQPLPEDIDPALLQRLKATPSGTWFEFSPGAEGTRGAAAERAKLSWISPYSGRCLFVNRNGMRVADRRMEDLVRELEQGVARILETANLLQEAMNSVLAQLNNATPPTQAASAK